MPIDAERADQVRAALQAKLEEIDETSAVMTAPPDQAANISFGKRVGDGTQMAVDRMAQVGVHTQLLATREDIVRALAKLDDGSYGRCDVCGEPIPEGRLEALPWAVLCIKDAASK